MDKIDVLVARSPQSIDEPSTYRISPYLVLLSTILEQNSITSKVFNVDFLKKPRIFQYSPLEDRTIKNLKKILNLGHPKWKNCIKVLKQFEPKIIIIESHHSYNIPTSRILAKLAKELSMKVICISDDHYIPFILDKNIDIIIRKNEDVEPIVPEVCKRIIKNESVKRLPNLIINNSGNFLFTKDKLVLADLNKLPIPNRELVIDKKYYPPSSFGNIMAGRGCGYGCKFCVESSNLRLRKPDLVVKDIAQVYLKYKTRDFSFEIASFTRRNKWAMDVCKLIKRFKLDIIWGCYANATEINEEIVKRMKEAGCNKIAIGCESGSERVLRMMKKPLTTHHIIKASDIIKKFGISLYSGFIIGYPGEKLEDVKKTLSLISRCKPDFFILQFFVPHPSTRIFNELIKKGMIKDINLSEYFISNTKLKYEKNYEAKLKKIWKKYYKLSLLCEKVIWRKNFLYPHTIRCKLFEYMNYLVRQPSGFLYIKKYYNNSSFDS